MDNNKLIQRFVRGRDHDKAERCLSYLKEYIGSLEEANDGYRTILADPDAEIARLKEEIRSLQLKLKIQSSCSISSDERADGIAWYRQHKEDVHPERQGDDYHWTITPFPFGVDIDIVCDCCGSSYCVRNN